jgi:hypothetical protein
VNLRSLGIMIMIYGVGAILLPLVGFQLTVFYWMDKLPFPINLVFKLGAIYVGYRIWRNQDY